MSDLSVQFQQPPLPLTWEPEPDLCEYQLYPKDQQGPAEYCGNDADPDSEYCSDHNPDRVEPDWDSIGKDQRNGYDD